jgi:hypothetical protein
MSKQNVLVLGLVAALFVGWALWPKGGNEHLLDRQDANATSVVERAKRDVTPEKQKLINKIVPHKALYRMTLTEMRAGSPINEISGEMYYKWEDACDAWSTDHRFSIEYFYNDRPSIITTRHFVAWEDKSGDTMSFFTEGYTGAIEDKGIRGRAYRLKDGRGIVEYSSPEGYTQDLPKGFFFPADHSLATIDAALKGEMFFTAAMFDGTDDESVSEINVFIDQNSPALEIPKDVENSSIDYSLLSGRSWNTRLAFYDITEDDKASLIPSYEMTVRMHENGIVSDMIVEYDKFSVRQELMALSALSKPDC